MKAEELPEYICTKCAEKHIAKHGKHETLGYGYTLTQNTCPLCKEVGMLATLSDFGIKREAKVNWD